LSKTFACFFGSDGIQQVDIFAEAYVNQDGSLAAYSNGEVVDFTAPFYERWGKEAGIFIYAYRI